MKNCFINNGDGAGLAWADKEGLHIEKGYFHWKDLWRDMKALEEYPVLAHFRIATQGKVEKANCHPFYLKNGLAMAHNGMINIRPLAPNMTDSESFGRKFIEPFSISVLREGPVKELLEAVLGRSNKIAMLGEDGEFLFLNLESGIEFKGLWFSNDTFEYDQTKLVWDRWGYPARGYRVTRRRNHRFPDPFDDVDWDDWDDPFFAPDEETARSLMRFNDAEIAAASDVEM
jgi:hypothetical protein